MTTEESEQIQENIITCVHSHLDCLTQIEDLRKLNDDLCQIIVDQCKLQTQL